MEIVRNVFAGCPAWCKFHLAKTVSSAGRHRTALTSCRIIQYDLQTMCSVMHGDNNSITRTHEQVRRRIGGQGSYGCINRIGRRGWLRMPTLGDESEVDVFLATKNFTLTGRIQDLTCYRVIRQAVDVEGSAPLRWITTNATSSLKWHPTGWIELHLHESCARMPGADRWIDDVLIAVWRAGAEKFWIRLCVTHRHTEPERGVEFKIEGLTPLCRSCRRWVCGKYETISHLVP